MALRPALSVLDLATLAYLAFAAVVMGGRGGTAAAPAVAAQSLLALVALVAPRLRHHGGVAAFVGAFYPLLALVGLYTTIGLVNTAAGVSHDAAVQGWEQGLFGTQPARVWIRAWPSPALSWLLHAGYLSYYLILAAPLVLWLARRRAAAERVVLAIMVTFYACFTVFLLFPVAGPRYAFAPADNAATRTAIARAAQRLLDNGAAWGTAFPSSHVAASLASSLATLREWREPGAAFLVLAVLLSLGTVYGQFHYALDVLAGAAVAGGVLAAVRGRA